jgi:hypothetical protein
MTAKMIVAENDCGRKGLFPLLDIRLGCPTEYGPVTVSVTGPAGAEEFLRTVLFKFKAEASA